MSFRSLYRASLYLMLVLANTILSVDAGSLNRFAMLFPVAVALASCAAFLTVDRDPKRGLSRDLANFLAMGSFGIAFLEYWSDYGNLLLLALGHWLTYLMLVKMFLPKTTEDDWFLFLLGLVQVLIGVFISQSDAVGQLLTAWALLAVWTLGLFHLHREAERPIAVPGVTITPAPPRVNPYPGLVNRSFLIGAFGIACLTFFLGAFIFLLMPRWSARAGSTSRGQPGPSYLTGFSGSVRLGQLGEILENDQIVMTIESFDEDDQKIHPPEDSLWRGSILVDYDGRSWSKDKDYPPDYYRRIAHIEPPVRFRRHTIKLEPIQTEYLFAPRPFFRVAGRTTEILYNTHDSTIARRNEPLPQGVIAAFSNRGAGFDYQVFTFADPHSIQPYEVYPAHFPLGPRRSLYEAMLAIPNQDLADRLASIAQEVVAKIPAHNHEARARALEGYLNNSARFTYSLEMSVTQSGIDPVLDFLVNRRKGHCEYFASSLVLLCRSIGIPARLVTGFKGGDWNELAGVLSVRQKHAHSWVEILVNEPTWIEYHLQEQNVLPVPLWLTLDPTPSDAREAIVSQVGGMTGRFRTISDFVRFIWLFYVVGYDRDRQQRVIYDPIVQLWNLCRAGASRLISSATSSVRSLLNFRTASEFLSLRGFFVSVIGLLILLAALWLAVRLIRRLLRVLKRHSRTTNDLDVGEAYFRRLCQLLTQIGLTRTPSETPREFAARAAVQLASRDEGPVRSSRIPALVVDAYYGMRFGRQSLTPETQARLDTGLAHLAVALQPSAT
jgi:transglutaminase-like putative cysteine protease